MAVEGVRSIQATSYQPQVSSASSADSASDMDVRVKEPAATDNVAGASVTDYKMGAGADPEEMLANEKEPSDALIKQAIKTINKKMNATIAEFGYHEGTHRVTIKIKDKNTDKVVKEIPAEKTLDMIEKAWELAGILVDEKR